MHPPTAFLTTLTLLAPLAHCIPAYIPTDPWSKPPVTCKATPNVPIADYARKPTWGANMLYCLDKLDGPSWDGAECHPTDNLPGKMVGQQVVDAPPPADAVALGPSFGFYKGGDGSGADGQACFVACSDCLERSIDAMQAVTTKCTYETKDMSCWMGMEVGT